MLIAFFFVTLFVTSKSHIAEVHVRENVRGSACENQNNSVTTAEDGAVTRSTISGLVGTEFVSRYISISEYRYTLFSHTNN